MRSIKLSLLKYTATSWEVAVYLTEIYLKSHRKADQLLDELPNHFNGARRAAAQSLFFGALRHGHRTHAALKGLLRKKVNSFIEAIFLVTGYELIEAESQRHPKIIHHAVERSKSRANRFEQSFLNAVLRKLPEAFALMDPDRLPSAYFSHPEWLVAHWKEEFPENYTHLLQWNQTIPKTYLRIYDDTLGCPPGLIPTNWPEFFEITGEVSRERALHPILNRGNAYIKDPATRLASEWLAPLPGESVLDLCAAPGGKTFDLAHAMKLRGRIVAVDLPGKRIHYLEKNIESLNSPELDCTIIESDVLKLRPETFEAHNVPRLYDSVLLDAPCSNTGVIRRRTDVKWRLRSKDIETCAKLQIQLLRTATRFVRPGGHLLYSTCSIEKTENQAVVDAFLASAVGTPFQLKASTISYPWETGHDGAGVFLIHHSGPE